MIPALLSHFVCTAHPGSHAHRCFLNILHTSAWQRAVPPWRCCKMLQRIAIGSGSDQGRTGCQTQHSVLTRILFDTPLASSTCVISSVPRTVTSQFPWGFPRSRPLPVTRQPVLRLVQTRAFQDQRLELAFRMRKTLILNRRVFETMRKGGRGRILEGERIQEANQPPSSFVPHFRGTNCTGRLSVLKLKQRVLCCSTEYKSTVRHRN